MFLHHSIVTVTMTACACLYERMNKRTNKRMNERQPVNKRMSNHFRQNFNRIVYKSLYKLHLYKPMFTMAIYYASQNDIELT